MDTFTVIVVHQVHLSVSYPTFNLRQGSLSAYCQLPLVLKQKSYLTVLPRLYRGLRNVGTLRKECGRRGRI